MQANEVHVCHGVCVDFRREFWKLVHLCALGLNSGYQTCMARTFVGWAILLAPHQALPLLTVFSELCREIGRIKGCTDS